MLFAFKYKLNIPLLFSSNIFISPCLFNEAAHHIKKKPQTKTKKQICLYDVSCMAQKSSSTSYWQRAKIGEHHKLKQKVYQEKTKKNNTSETRLQRLDIKGCLAF